VTLNAMIEEETTHRGSQPTYNLELEVDKRKGGGPTVVSANGFHVRRFAIVSEVQRRDFVCGSGSRLQNKGEMLAERGPGTDKQAMRTRPISHGAALVSRARVSE